MWNFIEIKYIYIWRNFGRYHFDPMKLFESLHVGYGGEKCPSGLSGAVTMHQSSFSVYCRERLQPIREYTIHMMTFLLLAGKSPSHQLKTCPIDSKSLHNNIHIKKSASFLWYGKGIVGNHRKCPLSQLWNSVNFSLTDTVNEHLRYVLSHQYSYCYLCHGFFRCKSICINSLIWFFNCMFIV